jgi:hypothetical protein
VAMMSSEIERLQALLRNKNLEIERLKEQIKI